MTDQASTDARQVVVEAFGGPDQLKVRPVDLPEVGPGQVRLRLTSIGMNHAELMGRRGEYRLSSGDPPFVPGLEGGGVIEAVGDGVPAERVGQRVTLAPDTPRGDSSSGGTYRSHYLCDADDALPAPDRLPDDQLGAVWLSYLTGWGCLIWKQNIQAGQVVAFPAASSSAALAGAQIARQVGCTTIGLTRGESKVDLLQKTYDHVLTTHESVDGETRMRPWHRDIKRLTDSRGIDVIYDPVASGKYLDTEIKCLADGGCLWVYGLLGDTGPVDVTPLIRKRAAIRGWVLTELLEAGRDQWMAGVDYIFRQISEGRFEQVIGGRFPLDDVRRAHEAMESATHTGKLLLIP